MVLLGWPTSISALLATDLALIFATPPLIALSACALIADGGQVVMANAPRAAGEFWLLTAMHVVSYVFMMLAGCWLFAFSMELAAPGLVGDIVAASIVSVSLVSCWLWIISRC